MDGLLGPVHHQDVAGGDARADHGIAAHFHHEGGGGIAHQIGVQVEGAFD